GSPVVGHRVEAERGLAPSPRPTECVDRSGRQAVEWAATGATPRTHGTGNRLGRDLRMDLERVVAVEAVSLAASIRQQQDSSVALPTPCVAVPAIGKYAHD